MVELTKSTFTSEEAAELTKRGYEMIEIAECGRDNYWVIAYLPQPNKENKEPSW